mgnify:CR=1 FL=1
MMTAIKSKICDIPAILYGENSDRSTGSPRDCRAA